MPRQEMHADSSMGGLIVKGNDNRDAVNVSFRELKCAATATHGAFRINKPQSNQATNIVHAALGYTILEFATQRDG